MPHHSPVIPPQPHAVTDLEPPLFRVTDLANDQLVHRGLEHPAGGEVHLRVHRKILGLYAKDRKADA